MKKNVLYIVMLSASIAAAQTKPAAAPPRLTMTEQVALTSLLNQNKQIQEQDAQVRQQFAQIEAEIKTSHPGYHLDVASGQLVADPPPAPKKDEPKK